MMDINEVIKQIPFWKNLSDEEKKQLLSGAVLRIYKKDSYIYGMTDACLGMIYVQKVLFEFISQAKKDVKLLCSILEAENAVFCRLPV